MGNGIMVVIYLAIVVLEIAAIWRVFTKAGEPGWAAIIPIYNAIVMLRIAGRPVWWIVLYFIPVANLIAGIVVLVDLARAYGKGTGFAIGLLLLSFIFFPILGFGSARYIGTRSTITSDGPRIQPAI